MSDPWASCRWAREAVADARHGILGTVAPSGDARLVPIVFALVSEPSGDVLVGAVDHKPKTTTQLARLADISRTGRATLLVEHYEDDWSRLWWARVTGLAQVVDASPLVAALVAKYPQYDERRPAGPCYLLRVERVAAWRAAGG